MIIVVLDGHTLNPGDLSWDQLEALGDCTIHGRTPPSEVTERAVNAETGDTKEMTGAELLSAGLAIELPPRTGAIWFYAQRGRFGSPA